MPVDLIYKFSLWILPILFAITLHEAGHAWAANYFGDNTAKQLGRVTLNPIPHVDPIGTIVVPLVLFFSSPFLIGWAKPVPVNTRQLKNPVKDMAWVALAGPIANIIMVCFWALAYKILSGFSGSAVIQGFQYMCIAGIYINVLLAVFNLIPLLPLDGGKVVMSFLPAKARQSMQWMEQYGFFILVGLLILTPLGQWLALFIMKITVLFMHLFLIDNPQIILQEFFSMLYS